MNNYWLLLLPIATTFGWFSATYGKRRNKKRVNFQRHYLRGLNFLLNEQPDKAVDVFVKTIDVDDETIETHLALGNLFRRRGEVDRAIRIHQNLISRTQLNHESRAQGLYALAKDYMTAGVLDRAERLLLELVDIDEKHTPGLRDLLNIYQQEKDWQKAINTAQKLAASSGNNMQTETAQFCCEQAEITQKEGDIVPAIKLAKRAMAINSGSVRASLLLGRLEMLQDNPGQALRFLRKIRKQNPDWLLVAIPMICEAYIALDQSKELIEYMCDILHESPQMPIVANIADLIRQYDSEQAALAFVAEHVREHPSVVGLNDLLKIQLLSKKDESNDDLTILGSLTERLLKEKSNYQCVNCGFHANVLHWHCPSCKQWETTKPAYLVDDV